jgi:hypothetical protein
MSILHIIIALVVLGLVLWLVFKLPIDQDIKNVIKWVTIAVVIIWLLHGFGLFAYLAEIRV